ncbi:MAG: methyl-accepting chemotaxis protein [Clostridiales bacterium]
MFIRNLKYKILNGETERIIHDIAIKIFRRGRIKTKLMISFLFLSIVPLTIVGIGSTKKSTNSIIELGKNSSEQVVNQLRQSIDITLKNEQENIIKASQNNNLINYVEQVNEDNSNNMNIIMEYMNEYKKVLNNINAINKDILGIEVFLSEIDNKKFNNSFTTSLIKLYPDDIKNSSLAVLTKKNKLDVIWSFVRESDNERSQPRNINAVTATLPIFNINYGTKKIGFISASYSDNLFKKIYNDTKIAENSYIIITDKDGRLISDGSNDKFAKGSKLGLKLKESKNIFDEIKKLDKKDNNVSSSFETNYNNKNIVVAYSTSKITGWKIISFVPSESLTKDSKEIWQFTVIGIFLCLIISIIISYGVSTGISTPLNNIMKLMKKAEKGDLTVSVNDKHSDEIAWLSISFDKMIKNINNLVLNINNTTKDVLKYSKVINEKSITSKESSKLILNGSEEVANKAVEQMNNVNSGVSSVNSLAEGIVAVKNDMIVVNERMLETSQKNEKAIESIDTLNKKAIDTDNVVNEIKYVTGYLSTNIKEIKKIVKMISNFSKQTKLLALNARIEATKAGNSGKGFIVVADEVKRLANMTDKSIKLISDLTNTIVENTEKTVKAANKTHSIVSGQLSEVEKTGLIFSSIINSIKQIEPKVNNTFNSVIKISKLRENTLNSISDISDISTHFASISEEFVATISEQIENQKHIQKFADDLKNLSSSLEEQLSIFKINN